MPSPAASVARSTRTGSFAGSSVNWARMYSRSSGIVEPWITASTSAYPRCVSTRVSQSTVWAYSLNTTTRSSDHSAPSGRHTWSRNDTKASARESGRFS